MTRPRRSHLFMPGSNPRALEKARNLAADGLILDLEDSVAPDAKAVARDGIAAAIAAKGFGKREILIRTNGLDTPWWADDVAMAANASPDGILVPKVSRVEELDTIGRRLAELGAAPTVKVWAMSRPRARYCMPKNSLPPGAIQRGACQASCSGPTTSRARRASRCCRAARR